MFDSGDQKLCEWEASMPSKVTTTFYGSFINLKKKKNTETFHTAKDIVRSEVDLGELHKFDKELLNQLQAKFFHGVQCHV